MLCSVTASAVLALTPPQELGSGRRFVLKSISYDSVHRADLMLLPCSRAKLSAYLARPDISITQQCPWILQEFIQVGCGELPLHGAQRAGCF